MQPSHYVVPEDLAGARLDVFLARSDPDRSRGLFQRAIEEGRVRLNGRRAKKWERVAAGDTVDVEPLSPPSARPAPDPGVPFVVVHEDEHVLVVDKPAGVPTHPHRPDERGTLAGGLLARYPDLAGVGPQPLEPGLVHRLDTQTSGLLVVARTPAAFRALQAAFAERRVEKVYLALVLGAPPAATTVTTPVGHHPTDPRRMVVQGDPAGPPRSPRPATTHLAVLRRLGPYTEVEVRIDTGRMHQIRAHLASIGHPVAGDALYQKPAEFARDRLGLTRPFLHAARLAFDHPADGRRVEFSAPLPPDLVTALARLEQADLGIEAGLAPAAGAAAAQTPKRRPRRPKVPPRPPGRTFIRRPGGGKRREEGRAEERRPPIEEVAPEQAAGRAEVGGPQSSWLGLQVPDEGDVTFDLGERPPPREPERPAAREARPPRAPREARAPREERPRREREGRRERGGPPERRERGGPPERRERGGAAERAGPRERGRPPERRERGGAAERAGPRERGGPPERRERGPRREAPGRPGWRPRREWGEGWAERVVEDARPRPGEVFGARPERRGRGDRQERDARRAGAFAPTVGRRATPRPPARGWAERGGAGGPREKGRWGEARGLEQRRGPPAWGEKRARGGADRRGPAPWREPRRADAPGRGPGAGPGPEGRRGGPGAGPGPKGPRGRPGGGPRPKGPGRRPDRGPRRPRR